MISAKDREYMKRALRLAARGRGAVNPNPMVGAIVVKHGTIIGQGYHHRAGGPHAEIEALKNLKPTDNQKATLYVTLEPCSHQGKTPPCVEAIIVAGIARVVCAVQDPNPKVHGQGIALLQKAGIVVDVDVANDEARLLNEAFFVYHEKKRPFIAIKFAATLDGKLATSSGDSKWITNEVARDYARRLRGQYQAILVGSNTVLHDDPHLGVHSANAQDPLRIILDSKLQILPNAQVLRDANVLIVTTPQASNESLKVLQANSVNVVTLPGKSIDLMHLMRLLYDRNIISVFVEGGGAVIGSFLDQRLIDKVYAFYAPFLMGGINAVRITGQGAQTVQQSMRLDRISIKRMKDNFLVTGYPKSN